MSAVVSFFFFIMMTDETICDSVVNPEYNTEISSADFVNPHHLIFQAIRSSSYLSILSRLI